MGNDEFIKFMDDNELEEMHRKWMEYNGCKGMPIFNIFIYPTYEKYKKKFINEYKKLGID